MTKLPFSYFFLTSLVLATLGCGANEENQKLSEKLNNLAKAQAGEDILFNLAVSDAQKAMEKKDATALSKAVDQLRTLGNKGVNRLIEQASDASKGKQDRLTALIVLGEMGPQADSAVPKLKSLEKQDPDAEIRKAATEALGKIVPMQKDRKSQASSPG